MANKENTTTAPATLDQCATLGEVCQHILATYDNGQPFSPAGKMLLSTYLKKAKRK